MVGGEDNHFYFDQGKDPWPGRKRVKKTAKEIVRIIKNEDPDILLLQEVDANCRHSGYINQIKFLVQELKEVYPSYTSSVFWKHIFVPHPKYLGPADTRIAVFSKYKMSTVKRIPLPRDFTKNRFPNE